MFLDLLSLLWAPFLMCLVLTGIHAYLGVHVLAREVVFVDIALAQIAALGATAAFLFGFELDTWESYAFGLAATVVGALVLALTRTRERHVSQEAVIGIVYAVSSAAAVLLSDRAPHGVEHVRAMLVGSLLSVQGPEVVKVAILYAAVGLLHWLCRRPFFLISTRVQRSSARSASRCSSSGHSHARSGGARSRAAVCSSRRDDTSRGRDRLERACGLRARSDARARGHHERPGRRLARPARAPA